jgi:hypothetical protein
MQELEPHVAHVAFGPIGQLGTWRRTG